MEQTASESSHFGPHSDKLYAPLCGWAAILTATSSASNSKLATCEDFVPTFGQRCFMYGGTSRRGFRRAGDVAHSSRENETSSQRNKTAMASPPAPRLEADLFPSPENFDGIAPEDFVGGEHNHSFDTGLRDQHPIKWIVVEMRQRASCERVVVGNWE